MRVIPRFCAVVATSLALIAGCEGAAVTPAATTTRSDSAGVEIASSGSGDKALSWSLVPTMSVGGVADTALLLVDLRPAHIAADDRGRVFILDVPTGIVRVVESTGTLGAPLGRRGRGPGELASALGIAVAENGNILVSDDAKRVIVRWGGDGQLIDEAPFSAFVWGEQLRAASSGVVMQVRDMTSRQFRENLSRVTPDTEVVLAGFTWPPTQPPTYPSCPGYGVEAPPLFTPWLIWDARGDRTAVVNSARYEIDIFEGDRLVRRVRRAIEPVVVTSEIIAAEVKPLSVTRLGCTIPAEERARILGHMPVVPVISGIAIGPDGLLWVRRQAPGAGADPIDIFSAEGDYTGTLPGGTPFPAAFAGSDRLVELARDSLDVAVIRVFRLTMN